VTGARPGDQGPGRVVGGGSRLLRLLLVALLALAPLAAAEVALRLTGYRSTEDRYFQGFAGDLEIFEQVGGQYLVRPGLRDTFRAHAFPADRDGGALRIITAGDSVVWGHAGNDAQDPLRSFSEGLEGALRARFPGRQVDVVNLGARTYGSGRVLRVVEEGARLGADAVVVSVGSSLFLEHATRNAWAAWRTGRGAQLGRVRLVAFLADLLRSRVVSEGGLGEAELKGRDRALQAPFVDPAQAPAGNRRDEVLRQARRDLEAMADACARARIPLVFLTVPANLRWPPFLSRYPARDGEALKDLVARSGDLLQAGQADHALALLEPAVKAHPDVAALQYRLGQARDARGETALARGAYQAAKDFDYFPLRALSAYNNILRGVSAKEPGTLLVDLERVFAERAPDGVPDQRQFLDHCHPTQEMHAVMAAEVGAALLRIPGFGRAQRDEAHPARAGGAQPNSEGAGPPR
jgi:lysophospholipase L1-like esterase